jgi:hypothetical protein
VTRNRDFQGPAEGPADAGPSGGGLACLPLATNDPKAFAALSDPTLIHKDDSGPSFSFCQRTDHGFDGATGGMSPASQETRAAGRDGKLPTPLYAGSVAATDHDVFTMVTYARSWRLIM